MNKSKQKPDLDDDPSDIFEKTVMRQYGRPRNFGIANHVQCYLEAWPGSPDPSVFNLRYEGELSYVLVYEFLKKRGWEKVWENSSYRTKEMERPDQNILISKNYPGFMIEIQLDWSLSSSKRKKNYKKIKSYEIPDSVGSYPFYEMNEGDVVRINDFTMYTPSKNSDLWNAEFVKELVTFVEENEQPDRYKEDAEVGIIVIEQGDYNVRSFSLSNANTSFNEPNLHYGDGFEEFHNSVLKRIEEDSKGLILFHGEPGTGKTQYIRHLLKELCSANKAVLYSPPAVSASLAEPQMINFISDWIIGENRDCILLIEDAEPLLESRGGGADGRSTGISNLLNITDGILNDILGLMVIATFNIEISKIDPALLRPGRLVARKEFKRLTKDQVTKLSAALEMEPPAISDSKYPITIAEFYNNRQSKNILVHEWNNDSRRQIGFN